MSDRVPTFSEEAQYDLAERSVSLFENVSEAAMERFLAAVQETVILLLAFPKIGKAFTKGPTGTRRLAVKGQRGMGLLYLPTDAGITILRVLDSRREVRFNVH